MTNHIDRYEAVLTVAIREATKEHLAASGALIRKRVESSLLTALAICKQDAEDMYARIDREREAQQ